MIPNNSFGWLKMNNKQKKTWKHNKALEQAQAQIAKIVVEVQMVEIGVESLGLNALQSLHSLTNLISLAQAMMDSSNIT